MEDMIRQLQMDLIPQFQAMLRNKEPETGKDTTRKGRNRARTSDDHAGTSRDGTRSDDELLHSHSSGEAF
jgi:hypothetical protein